MIINPLATGTHEGRGGDMGGTRMGTRQGLNMQSFKIYLLGEHVFATVEFSRADLFLRCNIDEKSHDDSCLFMVTGSSDESQSVVWEIPCGITEHSGVVSIVAFVSVVVAAFLIVLTSIYYPHNQKSQ
ncbi:uncharacterized protein LOC131307728 [Rhododendron vialii]|uniref:uncharacterized protein LOC131307728 n=1 Tax=Rhododendron vialii TaxID=182163 RepID=UPI00265D9502|nr:uncharacterized protein LOC131307728 [Rhododendron vialii]